MSAVVPLGWLLTINAATILAFRIDKSRAGTGKRRISERTLLTLAMVGGSPGALFARARFRHKTRKQPFSTLLFAICAVQVALGVAVALSRS